MGALASIIHHDDKEEKHEIVHETIRQLPQYDIVGNEKLGSSGESISMKKLREMDPYLKYGGMYSGDIKDSDDFKYIHFKELPLFGPEHKSIMSKILTEELFAKLASKKSNQSYTLSNAIMTGVVTPNLIVGATAGDEHSWEVFKDLYYPIVKELHDFDPYTEKHASDIDHQKIVFSATQQQLFDNYVLSTRIRAVRNIGGYSLPAGTTAGERVAVEAILKKAFSDLSGDLKGTYFELGELTKEQKAYLHSKGFLFQIPTSKSLLTGAGAARSWPSNRGIFHNDSQTALVWVNEEDHCRIISMEIGGDVLSVFKRFGKLSELLDSIAAKNGTKIMCSDTLGYLGTCPSNVGTSLRASVMTVLPSFRALKGSDMLTTVCSAYGLRPKAPVLTGEVNGTVDERYDISNVQRIGRTEVELVQQLIDGVTTVLRLEQKLADGWNSAKLAEKLTLRTIFVGPPGCGKGTQAVKIREEYNLAHLSTGDMLRAAVKAGTDSGLRAKAVMEAGQLVGDDIVVGIIAEAISDSSCAKGFILDGFPRNVSQAELLDSLLTEKGQTIDCVIYLAVEDELLIKRITGRLTHPPSGRSYNIYFNPPKEEGKDDITGEPLVKRADDNEDTLRQRLDTFHSQTSGVLQHYSAKLINVKADGTMSSITRNVRDALNSVRKQKLTDE